MESSPEHLAQFTTRYRALKTSQTMNGDTNVGIVWTKKRRLSNTLRDVMVNGDAKWWAKQVIKGQYNQSEQENEYEEDVIRGTKVQVSGRGIASLEDSFEAASLCVSVQASYAGLASRWPSHCGVWREGNCAAQCRRADYSTKSNAVCGEGWPNTGTTRDDHRMSLWHDVVLFFVDEEHDVMS